MKTLIALLMLVAFNSALADEYPAWPELAPLFGKEKDSIQVKVFVTKWKLKEHTKGSSGGFTPENHSYSLLYRQNEIVTIILNVLPPPAGYGEESWTAYKPTLPFGIKQTDKPEELTERFGEPVSKIGTTWEHDGYQIWALFRKENGDLSELYISKISEPQPQQGEGGNG
ncbi:hypothetical protein [Sulfuriroseicoccus oceanibius]|uniref:Uncharacterized protein n=1 Tax=Sulfuriroseicoccus oceanibius TaxID=2707525 RepID=A0A7T7EZI6_9BACT|nr:hypothetical protein [Sulfuriroseicoccus oceanibius]QQL44061.1 hypothetical protein G3M56_009160 [Sulfuriroseicoccus oceanibius]